MKGEAWVMIEWTWRIERKRSIEFGAWSGERKIARGLEGLEGRVVEEISLGGRLPELCLRSSGGRWLQSFMIAEGAPVWVVKLAEGSCLSWEKGRLVREVLKA